MVFLPQLYKRILVLSSLAVLAGCSTNPATGESQFTALMPAGQEVQIGAAEHQKIIGSEGLYNNQQLAAYVQEVGQRVTANTERADVRYNFFVLDSSVVNAFALPGGYIYVTRGLLSLANSEAELAAVLAHEAGHITGRHAAERYSHSVVTSLGAAILSAAVNSSAVSQAAGLGSELYLKSYSRGQETQADDLGMRYLVKAGYDPLAMSRFLSSLNAHTQLESRLAGKDGDVETSYFSTHPATAERVTNTANQARAYPQGGKVEQGRYLQMIAGMTYGDSERHGFVRGHTFLHPQIGLAFDVPPDFHVINNPDEVVAVSRQSGAVMIFDMAANPRQADPATYLALGWMQGRLQDPVENMTANGMNGATVAYRGSLNGRSAIIRLVALEWAPGKIARFQIAIPDGTPDAVIDGLKTSTYSLRRIGEPEKHNLHPHVLRTVVAKQGDTVQSLAGRMPFDNLQEIRFRVLNGMTSQEQVIPGRVYKLVGI